MDSSFFVTSHGFSGFDAFMSNNMGLHWESQGGVRDPLVLDNGKGELKKVPISSGKKDASEVRNPAALKSHCEAERRRRERINGHLTTLRSFLCSTDKMDKATLLAQVISQVKVLKKQASEATKGLLIPTDADEVIVEPYSDADGPDRNFAFRASVCCNYSPELISEIRQSLEAFKLTISRAEVSTLEARIKNVIIITGCKDDLDVYGIEKFADLIRQSLCSVLDKISASEEYSPRTNLMSKRRRVSIFDNSSTSS